MNQYNKISQKLLFGLISAFGGIQRNDYLNLVSQIAKNDGSLFVIRIKLDKVDVIESPIIESIPWHSDLRARANSYKKLFEDVIKKFGLQVECSIALLLEDLSSGYDGCPMFSFQKHRDDKNLLLLPDFDSFLRYSDYIDGSSTVDTLGWSEKNELISFVGSTTGVSQAGHGIWNTMDVINSGQNNRINYAEKLYGKDNVIFLLKLVQSDDECELYLKNKPYVINEPVGISDQLKNKYLLSFDGNGATCSRVRNILRSNSALLKETSPYILFYFQDLIPDFHYIKFSSPDDIVRISKYLQNPIFDSLCENIAFNGCLFANRYLTWSYIWRFTYVMLNEYSNLMNGNENYIRNIFKFNETQNPINIFTHVSGIGDISLYPKSKCYYTSNNFIEGIMIEIGDFPLEPPSDFQYQCMFLDGSISDWNLRGKYCGTTNRGIPLAGFRIKSSHGASFKFKYRAFYIETSTGWCEDGEWCFIHDKKGLKGFEITLIV